MKLATPMINRHSALNVTGRIATKNGNGHGGHSNDLELMELRGQLAAINKAQAVIEFNLDGTVSMANENFLKVLGYSLDEIQGKHHSMFVEPAYRDSPEYKQFWRDLNDGKFQAAEYKRIGKGGREIWVRASYNPVLDGRGAVMDVPCHFLTEGSSGNDTGCRVPGEACRPWARAGQGSCGKQFLK